MASPEFTELARGFYLEGLAFDHARQAVWYSDVTGGGIHGVRLDGSKIAVLNPDRMWAGGIMLNHDGAVLSSGRHGIMWNHPERGISGWLIDQIDGTPINGINEMMPDGQGGILFGTIDLDMIVAGKDTRGAALYRLAADRSVTRLAAEIAFTNGIMFDAERQRLYCNETFRCCWAFDVGADFTLSNQRVMLDKSDVDGMALDAAGNLWITGFRTSKIVRITPDGDLLEPISTPDGPVTQLRFGGADARDMVITSVPRGSGDTLKEGGQIQQPQSVLYHGRSDAPGMLVQPAAFDLG